MATIRIQGEKERLAQIYFEYDPESAPLGEGGMGIVYRGWMHNIRTGQRREVAIKFLYSDLPAHIIERARREASVKLRNDSLIEMIAFVETVERDPLGASVNRYHVVSEYLHGVTLDKLLEGQVHNNLGSEIPFAKDLLEKMQTNSYQFAITVVRNLLPGLIALHSAGYVHRDIDPSNIMVTSNGHIKLIDFGIAKDMNAKNTNVKSVVGQFIGKPKYAAPELARGLVDSQNATTDLYAVGILLYELLIGKVPFDGDLAEVLDMQINKKMPLSNVKQKQIRQVIKKATEKKRSLRYQSAAEFLVAIEQLSSLPYPGKTIDKRMIRIAAIIIAAIGGYYLAGLMISRPTHVPSQPQPDEGQTAQLTYNEVKQLLFSPADAEKGLSELRTLSKQGDYQSTYLLSRLYFDYKQHQRVDSYDDTVATIRNNVSVLQDNRTAHTLLRKAIEQNPNDYRALYELGCNYKSSSRGTKQNTDSAYIYLDNARELANRAHDNNYIRAIEPRISNLPRPKNYRTYQNY